MREERAEYLDRLIFLYVLIAPEEIPGLFYVVGIAFYALENA